ncbi:MAG: hypothetical protein ABSB65_12760 [Candidatus Acidiferrales bacterium]|jgi:hypothetical protein
MLIAAFILVISIAALMQFAMFAWRASLVRTVSQQYVNETDASLQPYPKLLSSTSFAEVKAVYRDLCPELETSPTTNLRAVSVYYAVMSFVSRVGSFILPAEGLDWTQREMALCTQYATVRLSQRLERNISVVNEARSY